MPAAVRPVTRAGARADTLGGVLRYPQSLNQNVTPRDVNPRIELVSGGVTAIIASYLRALPPWIDDTTRDLGTDLYERMMLDPWVHSSIRVMVAAILAQGVQLAPAVKDDHPKFELAAEIADFCRVVLEELDTPLLEALSDLLECRAYGNRVAELVYRDSETDTDAFPQLAKRTSRPLVLDKVKVRPRQTLAFVVDPHANVLGLLALIPGLPLQVSVPGMPLSLPAGEGISILPREKFLILTNRPRNGDPRGQSDLRAAYNAWWLKMQVWGEYLKYLVRFASPSLVAMLSEQARAVPIITNGQPVLDPKTGQPMMRSPIDAVMDGLLAWRNGFVAVFPFGTKLEPVFMQGEGGAFLRSIEQFNREMVQAIVLQALATQEGEHQARAASQVHQDVLGLPIALTRQILALTLRRQVLRQVVIYNYGPDCERLTPLARIAETEQQDKAAIWTAVGAMAKSNWFGSWSQKRAVDVMIGLPPREMEEPEAEQQQPPAPQGEPDDGDDPDAEDAVDEEQDSEQEGQDG